MVFRTYSQLSALETFKERFEYLTIGGSVGRETFGPERYLNQGFYTSFEWKRVRDEVIARDLGCDLGVSGHDIYDKIIIHHMNPIQPEDIVHGNPDIIDPEYLISTRHETHNAIHYGDQKLLIMGLQERKPGDTKLW